MSGISFFLARRYLIPKRAFLGLITCISILGVTLGVTVLILVISVMTGFERELQRKVLGFDAHLIVSEGQAMENWPEIMETVRETPGVVGIAPFMQGPVIAEAYGQRFAPKIRGIDPELEKEVTDVSKHIVSGAFDLEGDHAVIGIELARLLGVGVGDTITIYSPGNLSDLMAELNSAEEGTTQDLAELRNLVLPAELVVAGIFQSGRFLYDSEFVLVPLHIGQELYGLQGGVHGLSVKTTDPYQVLEIQKALRERLPPRVAAISWIDMNRQLFEAISMERSVMFFILLFIVLVAAFGIMNTMITTTVLKTREIGILKALGAGTRQIIGIFLAQGVIVGILGTATGLALGMALVQWRNEVSDWLSRALNVEVFPAAVYQFERIPAEFVPMDIMVICVSAFLICAFAALLPAWAAARLDPVKALRYE